jgi:DNA uptake protein ComE-like DNA-binding protein
VDRDIIKITPEEASQIIETRERKGMFYCIEDGRYVGIDNRTGDAWTEDFKSLSACRRWLRQ